MKSKEDFETFAFESDWVTSIHKALDASSSSQQLQAFLNEYMPRYHYEIDQVRQKVQSFFAGDERKEIDQLRDIVDSLVMYSID